MDMGREERRHMAQLQLVQLASGGWIELRVDIDPAAVSPEDWRMIWDVEHRLVAYEQARIEQAQAAHDGE